MRRRQFLLDDSRPGGFIIMTNSDRGFEVIRNVVSSAGMRQFLPVAV